MEAARSLAGDRAFVTENEQLPTNNYSVLRGCGAGDGAFGGTGWCHAGGVECLGGEHLCLGAPLADLDRLRFGSGGVGNRIVAILHGGANDPEDDVGSREGSGHEILGDIRLDVAVGTGHMGTY